MNPTRKNDIRSSIIINNIGRSLFLFISSILIDAKLGRLCRSKWIKRSGDKRRNTKAGSEHPIPNSIPHPAGDGDKLWINKNRGITFPKAQIRKSGQPDRTQSSQNQAVSPKMGESHKGKAGFNQAKSLFGLPNPPNSVDIHRWFCSYPHSTLQIIKSICNQPLIFRLMVSTASFQALSFWIILRHREQLEEIVVWSRPPIWTPISA